MERCSTESATREHAGIVVNKTTIISSGTPQVPRCEEDEQLFFLQLLVLRLRKMDGLRFGRSRTAQTKRHTQITLLHATRSNWKDVDGRNSDIFSNADFDVSPSKVLNSSHSERNCMWAASNDYVETQKLWCYVRLLIPKGH